MDILQKILDSTKARVEREKTQVSLKEMQGEAEAIYKAQMKFWQDFIKSSATQLCSADSVIATSCSVDSAIMDSKALDSHTAKSRADFERESSVFSSLRELLAISVSTLADSWQSKLAPSLQEKSQICHSNLADCKFKPPFAFERALQCAKSAQDSHDLQNSKMHFICEVKKASPSKGVIAQDFPYLQIAQDYESAGADCVSCLTEPEFFCGADSYLSEIARAVKIPILRKDFIIDSYMIYQAKTLGADCVLLISEILELAQMVEFSEIAHSLGLSVLIESHSESALQNALQTNAKLIGVNNRDLRTFKVDLTTSIRLKKLVPSNRIFVSESGIATRADIELLQANGINAVLIGESLMLKSNKTHALQMLKGEKL